MTHRGLDWSRIGIVAALGLGVALAVAQVAHLTPLAQDAAVYYRAQPGQLYAERYAFAVSPFAYSPAFADALAPFRLLPERVFTGLWQLLLVGSLAAMVRGLAVPLLLVAVLPVGQPWNLVASDVAMGNIHVLLGAVAVFGLRYPALWSFALLSKVTPGVGLLWFVARGEWRNLGIALGATAAIAAASFAFVPGDWFAWARFIQGGTDFPLWVVPVPLWIRLPMSAALVWWGAKTDRPWVVPIACGWVIPIPYPTMLAVMAGSLAFLPHRGVSPWHWPGTPKWRWSAPPVIGERPKKG
jgi:hypothetical protein